MTIRQKSSTEFSTEPERGLAALSPVRSGRSLTNQVIDRLMAEISSGRLPAGHRLPTERELVEGMKVSRTVVREAVAGLKARGLVVTRQGAGAFVAPPPKREDFFNLDPAFMRSLGSALSILELRLALESEAVSLACQRADEAALRRIAQAHAAFERAIDAGQPAAEEDGAFHLEIARATGNPHFQELLGMAGRIVIPRQDKRILEMTAAGQATYLARIRGEHREIAEAIQARDAGAARSAMRRHLTNAATRYRRFGTAAESPASE